VTKRVPILTLRLVDPGGAVHPEPARLLDDDTIGWFPAPIGIWSGLAVMVGSLCVLRAGFDQPEPMIFPADHRFTLNLLEVPQAKALGVNIGGYLR
jgi:hypothetical protein